MVCTCSTSPSVIGWVWYRLLLLRARVSPLARGPWLDGCARRLKSAIFSARVSVERSGSSWPSSPGDAWRARSVSAPSSASRTSLACSLTMDFCWEDACKLYDIHTRLLRNTQCVSYEIHYNHLQGWVAWLYLPCAIKTIIKKQLHFIKLHTFRMNTHAWIDYTSNCDSCNNMNKAV